MRFNKLMKPLSRFLGPTPDSTPDITAPLPADSPERIDATANGNGDDAERAAAIPRLPDGPSLRALAGLGTSPSRASAHLERLAQERLAHLIDAGQADIEGFTTARGTAITAAMLNVAGLSRHSDHLPRLLAAIDDPQRISALVVEGSSSRIRQLAAQRVEDPATLRQLQRLVRDKDKNVYKIIKQKCDALRAEELKVAQVASDAMAACASLERHSHRIYDAIYIPSFEHFRDRWHAVEALAAPDVRERALQSIDRCREVIASHERQIEDHAARAAEAEARQAARQAASAHAEEESQRRREQDAEAAAQAAALREAEASAIAAKKAAEALAVRQLGGLLAKANAELRDGHTGRAAGLRRAIEEKLPALPVVPVYLASQVTKLDTALRELKEWKEHAVAPKRAELIQEMESLVGSPEEPKRLADKIKQLQEDWKTISKGVVIDSEADWQRFHLASVAAYQPCRDYFEAQAKMRLANLEQRRRVLERLRAFETGHSAESLDWRLLSTVLREAPQELRKYSPVERKAAAAVQQDFDEVLGRLQARLDAWYAGNEADKQRLIQRAHALLGKDPREAVDAVKRLQLDWKNVGPLPRDLEQRLWEDFREQCDAVFQKRQQAHQDYTAGLESNKSQAAELCAAVEQAGGLAGPELIAAVGKIPEWRAAFEALGEMPRSEQRAIHDRFERAIKAIQGQLAQQRTRDKEQGFTQLFEAARRINEYGWSEDDALKQAAEGYIANLPPLPKGAAQALATAWTKAQTVPRDSAANETELRMLCIRAEICTDRATPAEDQALRREYQVKRLMQRMGQGGQDDVTVDALALEWVRVGPVPPATRELLEARFLRCR